MAKFKFATVTTNKRAPTTTEEQQGFPCGPLSQPLWNFLFHQMGQELDHLIEYVGFTPDHGDTTQIRQAIEALIDQATGGNPAGYVLMSQARATLPIYPEVNTADGRIPTVAQAVGTLRIPAGYTFVHRGIFQVTTVQTDFATLANRIYHLRWTPTGGVGGTFSLNDISNLTYNPTGLPETSEVFDSKLDDMLISRVVTSAGNVLTVTNLANKHHLQAQYFKTTVSRANIPENLPWLDVTQNWARRPKYSILNYSVDATTGSEAYYKHNTRNWNRYTFSCLAQGYLIPGGTTQDYISGSVGVELFV